MSVETIKVGSNAVDASGIEIIDKTSKEPVISLAELNWTELIKQDMVGQAMSHYVDAMYVINELDGLPLEDFTDSSLRYLESIARSVEHEGRGYSRETKLIANRMIGYARFELKRRGAL